MAIFFTSYARLDNNKYTKLDEAIDELRERVRGLVGESTLDQVGFFDVEDIQTGADWVKKLGHAVSRCRVFVCFCTNTYFNREICGKEFEAFRQRLGGAPLAGRYIIPVVWDKCILPTALSKLHVNAPGMPKAYLEDGLLSLRRLRKDTEYTTAIEAIARAIVQALNDPPLPDGPHPIDFDQLPFAFDNPGADAINVAVLADDGLRWSLGPGNSTARFQVERATAKLGVRWRQLDWGPGFSARLSAATAGQGFVFIVPEPQGLWSTRLGDVDLALQQALGVRCAVLAGYAGVAPASADDVVATLLPSSASRLEFRAVFDQRSPDQLVEKIAIGVDRLRTSALSAGNVARVSDAALEQSARAVGVDAALPTLAGPGL